MNKLVICIMFSLVWLPALVLAQEKPDDLTFRQVKGVITQFEEQSVDENGFNQSIFQVKGEDGVLYRVNTADSYVEGLRYDLSEGNKVILQILQNQDGTESAFLADVVRTGSLFWIGIFFAFLIMAIGLWRGLLALAGLVVTMAIIFGVLFPQILAGTDPLWATLAASVAILAINIPLCHGLSKITATAFLGTLGGLFSSVLFAKWFTNAVWLSGMANEDAVFLVWKTTEIDPRGILLAAIILGAVGVFDDVAITQAESVFEIAKADSKLSARELYKRAMRIGRHHIASMINTLVLAYVAVSMPLFLLFMHSTAGWSDFLNTELVAEEIVRTLAGTSALILTVPLTTWLAAGIYKKRPLSFDTKNKAE